MSKSAPSHSKSKNSPEDRKAARSQPSFVVEHCFTAARDDSTLPIFVVSVQDYADWLSSAPAEIQSWLQTNQFRAKAGACALLPQADGCAGAVITVSDTSSPWEYCGLTKILPTGTYEAEPELDSSIAHALCLGWILSSYQYDCYKSKTKARARTLVWPEEAPRQLILATGQAICLARDLVNTPASDMGPAELASVAETMAKQHGAKLNIIIGDALLLKNYPMIHAVGRASVRAPRLIDLTWGDNHHPKLTLVGKGVCFDTGGLDIKPAQFMKLMKKDMGGAALVLGLAHLVMSEKLKVRLRVLVPAVENSVSGDAMRPLDVLDTRKGITVEVGDTDAEGRLILGDALYEATTEAPDLVVDAATLTGAARVALGTEVPVVFANSDSTWNSLFAASELTQDPLWRLPFIDSYRRKLDSKVADICNISSDAFAGAITAALFLREFVADKVDWVHIDTMGYNLEARPGRPAGGEAMGLLAVFQMLKSRYASAPAEVDEQAKALAGTRIEAKAITPSKAKLPSKSKRSSKNERSSKTKHGKK